MPQLFDLLTFQIDHIIARKHHGTDEPDNLALACFACNNHKGPNVAGVDRDSGEVVRLFHPRRDRWGEHFEWNGKQQACQHAARRKRGDQAGRAQRKLRTG